MTHRKNHMMTGICTKKLSSTSRRQIAIWVFMKSSDIYTSIKGIGISGVLQRRRWESFFCTYNSLIFLIRSFSRIKALP
jgi:hypothetical protein